MKFHIICHVFNHKFQHGEEWGEVREYLGSKVADILFHAPNHLEVRTVTPDYPNENSPNADNLIGIFPTQKSALVGIKDYFKRECGKVKG